MSKRVRKPKIAKKSPDSTRRLFIDPASISTGWAYFVGKELKNHGTIAVENALDVFTRLGKISRLYYQTVVTDSVDEVHIEQLPRRCHHYTHWSVGVIGTAIVPHCTNIKADIPVPSWQKHCEWKSGAKRVKALAGRVGSEDELAAIGMGLWYVETKT